MESSQKISAQPWLNAIGSRYFLDWLAQQHCSLAFTTYQTGKLFLVGRKSASGAVVPSGQADQALSIFERTYNHCMGMWASPDGRTIWLSSRYQIWRLEQAPANAVPYVPAKDTVPANETAPDSGDVQQLPPAWVGRGYDFAYIPRVGYTTGHIDVHDLAIDDDGRLIFVNTMFGCLATFSERANFQPLWRPPFLSALVPEDRCHLNGLAMQGGRPAFVTVVSRSDVADGWRDKRHDGGCVLEVPTGETVCAGLSMPHSPRWYRDRLWVLNSGTGEFGHVDLAGGRFVPIAFCPGYLRGLTFHGDYAIATLSKPRHVSFQGLELNERLAQKGAEPQCGLQIIDLRSGVITEWLRLDGTLVTELYDAVVLPGVRQPMAVGFKTNEIERLLLIDEEGEL
jgi:uncharacterized protein (TIGR03032 family)